MESGTAYDRSACLRWQSHGSGTGPGLRDGCLRRSHSWYAPEDTMSPRIRTNITVLAHSLSFVGNIAYG